jgi:hypothetical protein
MIEALGAPRLRDRLTPSPAVALPGIGGRHGLLSRRVAERIEAMPRRERAPLAAGAHCALPAPRAGPIAGFCVTMRPIAACPRSADPCSAASR